MRKMIIAAALIFGLGSAQAQTKPPLNDGATEVQTVTMGLVTLASLVANGCKSWEVNLPAINGMMTAAQLTADDWKPGARFYARLKTLSGALEDLVDNIEPGRMCASAREVFGPKGTVQANLMLATKR